MTELVGYLGLICEGLDEDRDDAMDGLVVGNNIRVVLTDA